MSDKTFRSFFEIFILFTIFFFSNVSAFSLAWLSREFVIVQTFCWFVFALICFWFLTCQGQWTNFIKIFRTRTMIFPFLAFSALSFIWSVNWQISVLRWFTFLFTIVAGGYFAVRYNMQYMVKYLSYFMILVMLVCTIFVFYFPHVGIMNYYSIQGAWKGIFWHKNHMGFIAVFANTLFLINLINVIKSGNDRRLALFWGGVYVCSLLFALYTDSVGALLTSFILHGFIVLILLFQKFRTDLHKFHYAFFLLLIIFLAGVMFKNMDYIFAVFGRNSTLTGRIPMWGQLFDTYLNQRVFEGYGFNAFWHIQEHRVTMGHLADYPDPIVISDNGFIDVLMNTGLVGLLLFILLYFNAWRRAVILTKYDNGIISFFPIIFMLYTLVANVSWSLIFENENFFMLLIFYIVLVEQKGTDIQANMK